MSREDFRHGCMVARSIKNHEPFLARMAEHMKIKTLTLSYPHPDPNDASSSAPRYRIERVTDTVAYAPGQYLKRVEVDELCGNKAWKVTVLQHREPPQADWKTR